MGKADRDRRSAREKIAAQQAQARRTAKRRRLLLAGSSVVVVLAVVLILIIVKLGQSTPAPGGTSASPAVARQVTTVPAATFDSVGKGSATGLKATSGQPLLTSGGKPEVLYMGGEYCPFCAAERWAITAALSRFGTFSGLNFIHSSPTDTYPNTPTLSFYKSSYTSKYVSFVPVEWYGQAEDGSTPFGHVYLQQPTSAQQALFTKYAGGSIPFVDVANQYLVPQAQYVPSDLAGLSWAQVAAAMHDPGSKVGQDIDGAANAITAAICKVTSGKPSNVCTSPGVTKAASAI